MMSFSNDAYSGGISSGNGSKINNIKSGVK